MLKIGLWLFVKHLQFFYFFIKLFPTKTGKIVCISRQENHLSLDFTLLNEELQKEEKSQIVFLTKRIPAGFFGKIGYYFHLYKQMYHLATSKVCILDSYCICASILHHKKELRIIQIWHAIGGGKKFAFQSLGNKAGRSETVAKAMKMHENYDYVISSSSNTTSLFEEAFQVPKEQVITIGLPRIDYLIKDNNELKMSFKKQYPSFGEKPVVLYAPTFRKHKKNPVEEFIREFDFTKYQLLLRLHPNEKITIDDPRVFLCDYTTTECIPIVDIVITDYSATIFETAISQSKLFLFCYDYESYLKENGMNLDIKKELSPFYFETISALFEALSQPYNFEWLKNFGEKFVTYTDGTVTKRLCEFIKNQL